MDNVIHAFEAHLARERDALRRGDYRAIPELSVEKATLLEQLSTLRAAQLAHGDVDRLRASAALNQRLVAAVLDGLRTAQRTLQGPQGDLVTYGAQGRVAGLHRGQGRFTARC